MPLVPETDSHGPLPTTEPVAADSTTAVRAAIARLREGGATAEPVDFSGLQLVGEDLSGLDLTCANLVGTDLSRANLEAAVLFGAQLGGAVLFEANLAQAELSGANLERANLEGADLTRAGMGLAKLAGADLSRAVLNGATLTEADLTGADLRLADLRDARAREANFTRADLTKANCAGAEFDHSLVWKATLDGADLRGASLLNLREFAKASWIGVDMRDIDFTGAFLCRRFILDQNFIEEFRRRSPRTRLLYWVWRATSDCGRSVTRWAMCTFVMVMLFAWLFTIAGVDFGTYQTWLSPLYFSVVTITTLGYGDVLPSTAAGQFLVMCEVVTGYVMLGGLLSLFTNNMASRAE